MKKVRVGFTVLGVSVLIGCAVTTMQTFWQAFAQGGQVVVDINHYHEMYIEAIILGVGTIPAGLLFGWIVWKVCNELIVPKKS
jgi:hypothetical protein